MRTRLTITVLVLVAVTIAGAGAFFIALPGGGPEGAAVAPAAIAQVSASGPTPDAGRGDAASGDAASGGPIPVASPASKNEPELQSSLGELSAVLERAGPGAAAEFASQRGIRIKDGLVQVVLESSASSGEAAGAATSVSGRVEATHENLVQAVVPVERLRELAASASVAYVREPARPTTFAVSEGVSDIGATTWHSAGKTGAGVKVAVVDPGFAGYDQRVAAGELPADVITMSFVAGGDITGGGESHGTACAEIVYDMAPGAQLYLVNFNTDVELGQAIDYLTAQDIDVVSASWGFFGSFRGDGQGPINTMVQDAVTAGAVWANAAGNSAQNHWSGHFTDADADNLHEFALSDEGNDIYLNAGTTVSGFLTWDSWPVTDQDYDVYLVWEGLPGQGQQIVAGGINEQSGTQDPAEQFHYTVPPGRGGRYWILIHNYSASGNANFHLYSFPSSLQYQVAAGSLGGQPTDSASVMTVGAVPFGSTIIEAFSSRGPTTDGRTKPDIVAPDRVTTVTYGAQSFWGTSAAAPHAAGAAALAAEEFPSFFPSQIQDFLETNATDLGSPGKDNTYGSGKLKLGDIWPPVVSLVQPSGIIYFTDATIDVYYSDIGSGIDTASVNVTLDGAPLTGCAVSSSQASCPVSGMLAGVKNIGGSVSDNEGNTVPISGSFTAACGKPQLNPGAPLPYWASYDDYLARELSVDWDFCNAGFNDALNVAIVGSVNTNSVLFASALPQTAGDIPGGGGCSRLTFKYLVPTGVLAFRSTTYVTAEDVCGTSYDYPAPYLVP